MTEQEQPKNDFMHKLALQIVERRNLVFLIVILGTIFTIFSRSWVKVESDLTTYLPKTSETRMGLDIMGERVYHLRFCRCHGGKHHAGRGRPAERRAGGPQGHPDDRVR